MVRRNPAGQGDATFNKSGLEENHDYFSALPFEHIDTVTGGLTLTFTDRVLPGNAGRELRVQRTYNSQSGQWTFGPAGVALHVNPGSWPNDLPNDVGPTVFTVDGGARRSGLPLFDYPGDLVKSRQVMVNDRLWIYDRAQRWLWMPDGTVSQYDPQGRLMRMTDPFGNSLDVEWRAAAGTVGPQGIVWQNLSDTQTRAVRFQLPNNASCTLGTEGVCPRARQNGRLTGAGWSDRRANIPTMPTTSLLTVGALYENSVRSLSGQPPAFTICH